MVHEMFGLSSRLRTSFYRVLLCCFAVGVVESANGQRDDMIGQFDTKTDVVAGRWQRLDGELIVGADAASRAVLAKNTPASYALTIEFTRNEGSNSIGVILPVGTRQCAFIMSAFDGEAHGIGVIDGRLAKDNVSTIKPGTLNSEHPYRLLIEVEVKGEAASISSTLDGRPFLKWSGNPSSLSMLDLWKLPSNKNVGLCTYAPTTFHAISLRPFDPTMRMTKPMSPAKATPDSHSRRSVLYDLGHGEGPVDPLSQIAKDTKISLAANSESIGNTTLRDHDLLILRVPTTRFSDAEGQAIAEFVRDGGSVLVVMDEERRTSLTATGINQVLKPFEMSFTDDVAYLHNCGAVARAGEIHRRDLEIPFSGGRGVGGGTPFGFQLDGDGKAAQPFAAMKKMDGGGRVILLADGMAAALMGTATGERLSGVPRNPVKTTYWGKDSQQFLTDVIQWLLDDE